MLAGAVILAVALTDHLVHLFVTGDHRIKRDLVESELRGVTRHGEPVDHHPFSLRPVHPARQRRLGRHGADGRRLGGHGAFHHPPRGRRDAYHHLVGLVVVDADRAAAVHLDGRDPLPHPPVGGHVPWPLALDGGAARRAGAHEYRGLHRLRSGVRILGGHADDGRQDVHPGAARAQLPRNHGDRHTGGRGDAGTDDSAVADIDRLWRDDQRKHFEAVLRRRPAGAGSGAVLHGLCGRPINAFARLEPAPRRSDDPLREIQELAVPDPGLLPDPPRDRLDVSGLCHRDGGGCLRRDRRVGSRGDPRVSDVEKFHREPAGRHSHLGDDRADPGRGGVPVAFDGFHRPAARPGRPDRGNGICRASNC